MNSGVIASRYAKALLKYVQEVGNGDKVYSQTCILALRIMNIARLKDYIQKHDDISVDKKIELLESCLGEPLAEELKSFLRLVVSRSRMEIFLRMLISFISQYRKEKGIKVGRIITAHPAEGLKERLEAVFSEKTGAEVQLVEKVDPAIIGGFIFELEDYRVDASVEEQLRRIGKGLIVKNNRIV